MKLKATAKLQQTVGKLICWKPTDEPLLGRYQQRNGAPPMTGALSYTMKANNSEIFRCNRIAMPGCIDQNMNNS